MSNEARRTIIYNSSRLFLASTRTELRSNVADVVDGWLGVRVLPDAKDGPKVKPPLFHDRDVKGGNRIKSVLVQCAVKHALYGLVITSVPKVTLRKGHYIK